MYPIQNCGSEPAREGGLTADLFSWMYPEPCGSGLAREGGLIADLYFVDQVHIHSCSNGHFWFRPYGESLLTNARNAGPDKRNQKVLPQASGPSLRFGVPSLRSCSVGSPPSAIPGRARLTRHPCRVTTAQNLHSAFRRGGQIKIKRPDGLIADLMSVKVIGGEHPCHSRQKSPVGASLLAIADLHSALRLTGTASSLAG